MVLDGIDQVLDQVLDGTFRKPVVPDTGGLQELRFVIARCAIIARWAILRAAQYEPQLP